MGGWEFDRIAYNDTMFSPYAPGGILLGTGENGRVQLGVQKNEIERYQCQEGFCRIVDGKEGDVFEIKRENKFLVVLECSGVMFTGDFVHAGVRNVEVGSKEDALMVDLNNRLQSSIFHGAQLREKHEDIRKVSEYSRVEKRQHFVTSRTFTTYLHERILHTRSLFLPMKGHNKHFLRIQRTI